MTRVLRPRRISAANTIGPGGVSAGIVGWWKADSLSLADGAAVTSWADSSGNGITLATVGSDPVFHTNVDGALPGVLFTDTSNQGLAAAGDLALPASGWTFFLVFKPLASGANAYRTILADASGFWYRSSQKLDVYTGSDHLSTTALAEGAVHKYMLLNDAANTTFTLDGAADGSYAISPALSVKYVGTDPSHESFNGYLFEMAAYNVALSAGDQSTVLTYLGRW